MPGALPLAPEVVAMVPDAAVLNVSGAASPPVPTPIWSTQWEPVVSYRPAPTQPLDNAASVALTSQVPGSASPSVQMRPRRVVPVRCRRTQYQVFAYRVFEA